MSENVKKSPISVLDEFCKRKLETAPEYTISSDASEFVCTVKSFNETKTAKAKSKKKAKHSAAHELIKHLRTMVSFKFDLKFLSDSIINSVDETEVSSSTTNDKKRKNTPNSTPDINYVGNLLEFCTKNKLPPPSFVPIENNTPTKTENQSHVFLMKCWVNDIERQGKGSSKKQAKKEAAKEMLNVLMERQTKSKVASESDQPSPKRLKISEPSKLLECDETANTTTSGNDAPVSQQQYKEEDKINTLNYACERSDYSENDESLDCISRESDSEEECDNDSSQELVYDYFKDS